MVCCETSVCRLRRFHTKGTHTQEDGNEKPQDKAVSMSPINMSVPGFVVMPHLATRLLSVTWVLLSALHFNKDSVCTQGYSVFTWGVGLVSDGTCWVCVVVREKRMVREREGGREKECNRGMERGGWVRGRKLPLTWLQRTSVRPSYRKEPQEVQQQGLRCSAVCTVRMSAFSVWRISLKDT